MDITELKRQQSFKRHPWELARVKIIKHFISKKSGSPDHIIDFGSGDNFVLNEICKAKMGKGYTAVDNAYTEVIIDAVKKTNSCEINYLKELPQTLNNKVDAVLILDVLEHCENDFAVLSSINTKELLTKDTMVFITVPAFQSVYSKHDELLLHYRRYNLKEIRKVCHQSNFEVINYGYFFTSLLIVRCIQLFLEKLGVRKPEKSIDNWNGSNTITNLICNLLWMDYKIGRFFSKIGIQIPGLSAYCICRPLPQ